MSIEIDLQPLEGIEALSKTWRSLEARADASFFLSWTWIGSLLAVSNADYFVVSARDGNRTLALGLFTPRRIKRHLIVRTRQLCLNESGDPALDRIMIEYNGLLVDRDAPSKLIQDVFQKMHALPSPRWQELVLSGVPSSYLDAAKRAGLIVEIDQSRPGFRLDLRAMRQAGTRYLDSVSSNTRAQIRRAQRLAEQSGPLQLDLANSPAEAAAYFEDMRACHEARWEGHGAFSSPQTIAFHKALMTIGFPRDEIELLRASAGNEPFGYLYNFRYRGAVLNYQSGFRRFENGRHKPGLLTHHLCIERALAMGCEVYDLLAGDARYKRSLAKADGELFWARIQVPDRILATERLARRIKQRASNQ
jgi:CelD/BcsL family acetyltransferase involved in cellulose biosynthesis